MLLEWELNWCFQRLITGGHLEKYKDSYNRRFVDNDQLCFCAWH